MDAPAVGSPVGAADWFRDTLWVLFGFIHSRRLPQVRAAVGWMGTSLFAALAGCEASCPAELSHDDEAPAWDGVDGWDPAQAEWAPADLEAEIEAVVARGFPSPNATAADFEAFIEVVVAERAPGAMGVRIEDDSMLTEHNGEGSLRDGTAYEGGWIYTKERRPEADGGELQDFRFIASFTITDPDLVPYIRGGEIRTTVTRTPDGSGRFYSVIGGRWSYAPSDSWVGLDQSVAVDLQGERTPAGDQVVLSGGLDGDVTLYVRDLTFDPGVCGGLPVGEVLLRDPTFYWHTITLTDDCTGCGEASWAGLPEGEVCVGDTLAMAVQKTTDDLWELR